jgi:predicted dehydrogenase
MPALRAHSGTEVRFVAGKGGDAAKLAAEASATALDDWTHAVTHPEVDAVIICTPPDLHLEIATAALSAGKHVLCEKPLTRTARDAARLHRLSRVHGAILKCGFNHRYHPAVAKAHEIFSSGALGTALFGRAIYGIGGRPGCENEWRSDPTRAAGGQLMEQGIHLIDLFRWFFGDFAFVSGAVSSLAFPIAPLEDSGFALLQRRDGVCASIHSTLAQWKNRFVFEVYGTAGYVEVTGLGGSYGSETLVFGKRDHYAPFAETVTEFRGRDISWDAEWANFVGAVQGGETLLGSSHDGVAAMVLIEAAYESARSGRRMDIEGANDEYA